jgi:hypothetical protein
MMAGVDRETAKTAWEKGWKGFQWAPSIKEVFEGEHLLTRAARQDLEEKLRLNALYEDDAKDAAGKALQQMVDEKIETAARQRLTEAEEKLNQLHALAEEKLKEANVQAKEIQREAEVKAAQRLERVEHEAKRRLADLLEKAKIDAAETMADEAALSKLGRKAALGAAAIAALMLQDARVIADHLRKALENPGQLTAMQAVKVARELGRLVESTERAIITALQIERLRVGEPTEVLGVQVVEDSSLEEEEVWVEAAAAAIRREREKRSAPQQLEAQNAPQEAGPNGGPPAGDGTVH